ncbi:hypothetical protein [Streptomyces sp. NPDC051569]|uniref:hypothetical protein n=1 Tax=Streptomyces sp. NPDC051569 TaxID=3365661 RepID=UPI00378DAB4A
MRQGKKRTFGRTAVAVVVLALAWGFAPSAVAGGPTSVLITSPESGEAAALYSSAEEYAELAEQLGTPETLPARGSGQRERPPSLDSAIGSRQITVTWMLHDVQPWRLDRVYPSADTSVLWIFTTQRSSPQDDTWHKAEQPAVLRALLGRLGLMGEKTGSGVGGAWLPSSWKTGANAPAAAPESRPESRAVPRAEAEAGPGTPGDGVTGWWWVAAAGLAAGTALGLVLRPMAGRLRGRPVRWGRDQEETGGPRQQLLDAPPDRLSSD